MHVIAPANASVKMRKREKRVIKGSKRTHALHESKSLNCLHIDGSALSGIRNIARNSNRIRIEHTKAHTHTQIGRSKRKKERKKDKKALRNQEPDSDSGEASREPSH